MAKSRILIVDDTPTNIKILADLLRKDYLLSVATSGADALEIARGQDRPDLVLLDIMMPDMDGYEVCRRLKAEPRTRHVPVIFITAMSEVDDETMGFSLGAVDYITKPIRPPIVKARAAALLMTAARACLRMRVARPGDLGEVVTDMNRHLVADLGDTARFMTFCLLEVHDDSVSWVSAGHEPALVVDPAKGTITALEGDGPFLGIDPDFSFREHRSPFSEPGQALALCTDGITETFNTEGEQFGRQRLKQSLLRHACHEASAILEGVMDDVTAFRGPQPQRDDLTLVVVKKTLTPP